MEQINPLDFLKEELDNDEIYVRVNAIHRLKTVAILIGTEGIKSQLLPFIDSLIKKEDDEVLFAIAEELGNLGVFLIQQQSILIPYLETLASVEETMVREMAVKSLNLICSSLNDYEIQNNYIPMIFKLASNEINFTCRVSAVNLMYSIYPRSGSQKEKIRQKFSELCNEETPMVKRAVASRIGEFAKNLEKDYVTNDIITLFKQLCEDDQDQVRVLCLESLKQLAKIFTKEEKKTFLIPLIIKATEDKSWRVRLALSKNFAELTEAFGKEITDVSLIPIFTNLLRDVENDVKIAAIGSLSSFIKLISPDKLSILIAPIQNLAKDGNAIVRSGITEVLTAMIPLLGREVSQQKILPYIIELFSDENTDVRIGVVQAASKYVMSANQDSLTSLSGHFKNAIQDSKWRVRIAVLEGAIDLALHFQNPDLMSKFLEPLFYCYLKDRAGSIRELGLSRLKQLVVTFKIDWVISSLLPKLQDALGKDSGYLTKITAVYSLQIVALSMPADFNRDRVLPILLKIAKDSVPNVRFVVAKTFKILGSSAFSGNTQPIKQCLIELAADSDRDVQFFAQDALKGF